MSRLPARLRSLPLLLLATFLSVGLVVGCGAPSTDTDASGDAAMTPPDGVGEPAWVNETVMYEMFIPDFSEEGTFRGAIDRLDELKAMGVTTIWLMPIHPVGEERAKTDIGALGSPYAVRDYKAVNPEYGGAEQFREFVSAVHERDMHVIIDWVANHTAWDHPWVDAHPEYYTRGPVDGRFTYPLLDGDTTDWTDVVDLNFDNQEMRAKMIDAMQYWVREFDIDGYRCDVAHQVPLDFWEAAIDSVEAVKPVLMLAEAAEPEMHDVGFDKTYAWPYFGALKHVWESGAPVSELMTQVDTTLADLASSARRLRFTTNHDETMWDATPPQLFGGIEGSKAAFVLTSTLPGTPLVYNGQELGIQDTVSFFASQPYDWDQEETLIPFYTDVLQLWRASPALHSGDLTIHTPDAEDAVLYERSTDSETMLIAVNIRDASTTLTMPDAVQGQTLTDALTDATVSGETLELGPYGYRLLRVQAAQ
jgi:glycosidase